ncbi:adenylyl-sulfate kinase [Sphingobacterium sp. SYP-B4668]|uniref:adenylyl-sulfate kinase n=1 Tax=Sphingobacterium sp. SYP-B4668 TaxID=2996035 RepID=UPI0022DD3880|nr:adenylyl-sulfate kinase [Sphingobacterium sp. SYP-B4668]
MPLKKGIIIQLTGLSGSGKSTLSKGVKSQLEGQGYRVAVVDGDECRKTLCSDLGFSKTDRVENIRRLGVLAETLITTHDVVLIAAINPYEEAREGLRVRYDAKVVYLECILEVLMVRDPKGLYYRAMLGEDHPDHISSFTGISDPFEYPQDADIVLDTAKQTVQKNTVTLAEWIVEQIEKRLHTACFHTFLSQIIAHIKAAPNEKNRSDSFSYDEQVFRFVFGLTLFDLIEYVYREFTDLNAFEKWVKKYDDEETFRAKIYEFYKLTHLVDGNQDYRTQILTDEQLEDWERDGYLQLSGLVSDEDCDAVVNTICRRLKIDLTNADTWWPTDSNKLQGIIIPSLHTHETKTVALNPKIRQVFEDLYQSRSIIPSVTPLGYNPPERVNYSFRGSPLHWDVDFLKGVSYYIQGLVYLSNVEEHGGAFSLIPGYQHRLASALQEYGTAEHVLELLRQQKVDVRLSGKKGDLIVWLEAIPHAATANRSDKPRFVQYVAYQKRESDGGTRLTSSLGVERN